MYCLETTTFSASGKFDVFIVFSPIVETNNSYLSDAGDKNTIAYSLPDSK